MNRIVFCAVTYTLALCQQGAPLRAAGPLEPPDWAAVPTVSAGVWPDIPVVPGPLILTLEFAAPPDNCAVGPFLDADGALGIAYHVVLRDDHGRVVARGGKSAEGRTSFYIWPTAIPPGHMLQDETTILWAYVDDDALGDLARRADEITGALSIAIKAPLGVRKHLAGTAATWDMSVPLRFRAAKSTDVLARSIFDEGLLVTPRSGSWGHPGPAGRKALEGRMTGHAPDPVWQTARGLLLLQDILRTAPELHGSSKAAQEAAALRDSVEGFAARFPGHPLVDNLLYLLEHRLRAPAALGPGPIPGDALEGIARRFPAGDVATNAWYLRNWGRTNVWPERRPVVASQPSNAGGADLD